VCANPRKPRKKSARRNPPSDRAARALYNDRHWGDQGRGGFTTLDAPTPKGPFAVLGRLVVVEYDTRKGNEDARYVHKFTHPVYLVEDRNGDLHIATVPGKRRYLMSRGGIVG
jgi:hypothetical protein